MQAGAVIAGRFVVERLAGAGGMGEVYRAFDRHTDRLAALKIMRSADAGAVQRFGREARILAELRHPSIVDYLAHGRTDDGVLFLAMEWLEGEDLAVRLATHALDLGECLAVATQAAAALAAAHARGVVHRDVKPSNLFLGDFQPGRLKLLDFGVARLGRLASLTLTGAAVGTPLFMAPEQARGERDVDARADVFALGAVLFRCLTGRLPFAAGSQPELLAHLLSDEPAPRPGSVADVPAAFDDLVARMLAKRPAERPADGAAVLSELIGLDATQQAGPRPRGGGLGVDERRVECVVLVDAPAGEALAAAAAAHGAILSSEGGGSALVFAGPGLATDHAERAARCALALRASWPAAALRLTVRRAQETRPGRAAAGAIVVDPAAAGLLSARFEVAGDSHGLLLAGERGIEHAARPLLGRETELVGRERELTLLDGALAGCVDDGAAAVVLVTAAAGMGKSRLRHDWLARARARGDFEVLAGHGDPMRAGAPYGLLGEALRRAAGIAGDEPLETRRALLRARVGRHLSSERAGEVTEFLGELAGVPFDAEDSVKLRAARRDPLLLAEKVRDAFVELCAAETAVHPLVLVLEDLQWGDLATVRLVDDALQALAERPLLVLGLARPEVADTFPRLFEQRGLQQIHLGPLPRRACERLVRGALGAAASDEAVAAIVERAGGNAFFVEELIRHVAEEGGGSLPDSVLAMAGARFEALPADVRRALRAASVFGEVFWSGGVAALLGCPPAAIEPALAELAARELVVRRRGSRFADADELAFRHGLLREAAYALLTAEDRALGHRLAGGWLAAAGEQEALVVAEHLERGGETGEAARHYQRAAEQALAASDADAALARAVRGARCGAGGEELGALLLLQATAHRARGNPGETRAAAVEAMRLLPRGSEAWFTAAGEAAGAAGKLSRVAELEALIETMDSACPPREQISPAHAVALARAATQAYLVAGVPVGDRALARLRPVPPQLEREPLILGWIHEALSIRADDPIDLIVHRDRTETAARYFSAAGDERAACALGLEVASFDLEIGRNEEAVSQLVAHVAQAERLRLHTAARLGRAYLSFALLGAGRLDEALTAARSAGDGFPRGVNARITAAAACALGLALAGAGRLDEAEAALRAGLAEGSAGLPFTIHIERDLAAVLARSGRAAEALEQLDSVLSRIATLPLRGHYLPTVLICQAEALAAAGRTAEARATLREARRRVSETAEKIPPDTRRAYLEAVPWNRRLTEIERELGA